MIVFDLSCNNQHTFEGWFEDRHAFEIQKKKCLISCPVCNDSSISIVPSGFSIKGKPSSISTPENVSDKKAYLQALGHQLSEYVEKNFDNVGADFADEALKMHYGVKEPRNIRGVSTKQEEDTLKKEGIDFFKFPISPSSSSSSDSET